MSRNKYILIGCSIIFLCITSMAIFLVGCKEKTQNNTASKTVSKLETLVSSSLKAEDDEILYSQLPEVVSEMKNFSDQDVLHALKDGEVSDTTKHIIIEQISQINDGKGMKEQSKFEELLKDDAVAESNKIAIIHALDFKNIESLEILEEIVYSENSAITTNALREVLRTSPKTALRISDEIIKNSSEYGEYQIKAAVMIRSDYLRDMSVNSFKDINPAEINSFISLCIQQYDSSMDETFKNAMIFSLMDINHMDAVRTIISNDNIDVLLKKSCVIKNYQTFTKALDKNVSNEDIECIIKAMEINPIKEIGVLLREKITSNSRYNTEEFSSLIEEISVNGSSANTKWVISKQKYNWES